MSRPSSSQVRAALAAAAALWCADGCLSPGSLEHEEKFRVLLDAGPLGDGSGQPSGEPGPGCAAACETFHTTCSAAACHLAENPAAQLDLQSPGIVERLSGAPAQSAPCFDKTLLVPGDPNRSLIYTKLISKPACGLRMPLTGPLADADIDCVRRWVLAPSCNDSADASMGSGGAAGSSGSGGSAGSAGSGGMNGNGGDVLGSSGGKGGRVGSGGRMGSGGASGAGGKGAGGMNGAGGMSSGGMPTDGGKPGSTVYFEAESGTLAAPMVVSMDAGASGGKYISAPGATKNDDPTASTMGIATFTFNVMNAGTFTAFGRVEAPATTSDSFWVKMDADAWIQWNNLPAGTAWTWDDVHDSGQADATVKYTLAAGSHTLLIAYREPDTWLDKIAVSSVPNFMPTGLGQ